jgi:UDP-N-acetylglucosamine 2-epimerase (non-hydrolysing)
MSSAEMARLSVFVIGTRAQLIKVAPVIAECERRNLPVVILITGQHKETMQDLLCEFEIRSRQIEVVAPAEHATILSLFLWLPAVVRGIRNQVAKLRASHPMLRVVVHGDTLSTWASAFAAKRCNVPVVHVESGLSSGKLFNPFPEEIARRLVFRLADTAMCPDETSAVYMRHKFECDVIETNGNTIIDAVSLVDLSKSTVAAQAPYLVVSIHRFQNIYGRKRLDSLVKMLILVSNHISVHFVLHPSTRKRLETCKLMMPLSEAAGINLSPRLGYADFLRLAAGADCVVTDGGSNQEELAVLGVPTIIVRETTERRDGLGANAVMEGELNNNLVNYLINREYQSLRRPRRQKTRMGPSSRVVDYLEKDE